MKRLAFLLCLLPGLAFIGPARADPPLFVARAPGITAYLLGSFHALKPGTEWETPAIKKAFGQSSECWFEVVLPKDKRDIAPTLSRGLDPTARLPSLLSNTDNARLKLWADTLRVPGGSPTLERMQPWMVLVTLLGAEIKAAGLQSTSGVEAQLQTEARRDWKAVVGLETVGSQLDIFASQPEPVVLRLLHESLARQPGEAGGKPLDTLLRHWMEGDVEALGEAVNGAARALGPSLYEALLPRRNRAWAEKLNRLKGRNTTIMVIVGAGHLAGPGNLREMLEARGFVVERVQP